MKSLLAALTLASFLFLGIQASATDHVLHVVAGTSLIEDIVNDLAGQRVQVRTIIPAAACPGHYDVKASDVAFVSKADLILLHDWQQRQPAIVSMLDGAGNLRAKTVVVSAGGNWMTPDRQKEAVLALRQALAKADPAFAPDYADKARQRLELIDQTAGLLKETMRQRQLTGLPVICDAMQRPLLEWLGFTVLADYGRFEDMGPKALSQVMALAKAGGARLVADNMQSTGAAGKALAHDLGQAHVTLSNFPGGYPDADTWAQAVTRNLDLIVKALHR